MNKHEEKIADNMYQYECEACKGPVIATYQRFYRPTLSRVTFWKLLVSLLMVIIILGGAFDAFVMMHDIGECLRGDTGKVWIVLTHILVLGYVLVDVTNNF